MLWQAFFMKKEDKKLQSRLDDLSSTLEQRAIDEEKNARKPSDTKGMGLGLKLGSEFLSAVLVGAAIGWFIDSFLNTTPFGLIVFLMLGFAAGVKNVIQSSGSLSTGIDKDVEAGKNAAKIDQDRSGQP